MPLVTSAGRTATLPEASAPTIRMKAPQPMSYMS